ncbi:MAG: tyrosine-type recombinase/integrase [Gammaproteobacteria bacterium]
MSQFTEKFIQAMKPKPERYDVREKSGDGFAIRVFPSGEKSWVFIYTHESRKRRMTLGSYPALSLADARKRHREALTKLAAGKDPGLLKKHQKIEARLSATIEDLINEYIEKWAKPRKRSWKEDKRMLDKDVKPLWGKRKAKDITKRDIILLLDDIKERGAPIASNRTLACVRRMFNFAIERDIIQSSPCVSVKAVAKENRRDRCLSVNEVKQLWHGLNDAKMSELTRLTLKLQLVTAQRKGEIISAEWEEVDLTTNWWTIPAHKAKNGYPHRVPLSALAIEILTQVKRLSDGSPWLFPSPTTSTHIQGESIAYAVRRSLPKLDGVNPFTPHDIRRAAATHMTAMGISRLVVSKILNHVDNTVTAIYDRHSYDAEKKNALEAWGNKLKQIIDTHEHIEKIIEIQSLRKQKQAVL